MNGAYRTFLLLARLVTLLALVVVVLGAWVRLTDAGLGCPDWPGCYGRLVVPDAATPAAELGSEFTRPLEAGKAWREMIHRYLASTLGLICVDNTCIAVGMVESDSGAAPVAPPRLLEAHGLLQFECSRIERVTRERPPCEHERLLLRQRTGRFVFILVAVEADHAGASRIDFDNPRVLYFNDSVSVGWVRDGIIAAGS